MSLSLQADLNHRRVQLWDLLERFVIIRDAYGVHDMAVEITGIELALKFIKTPTRNFGYHSDNGAPDETQS